MIVAEGLTKSFGGAVAVDDVSFEVAPGTLVGLVGPDGAGKTTTLRMLVGHVTPSSGSATILGKPYRQLKEPLRQVGTMLDPGLHPGRTAYDHLRICAATGGLGVGRISELLALVGLERETRWRTRDMTPSMRRRLALATALLAEPKVLILDDPADALDPERVRWLCCLLRSLADDGCAVLLSCQRADEVAGIADAVLIMDRGSLLCDAAPSELTKADAEVLLRSPGAEVLAEELQEAGLTPSAVSGDELRVRDMPVSVVSRLATSTGVPVWEVYENEPTLQEAVTELTASRPADAENDATQPEQHDDAEIALDEALGELPELRGANVAAVLAPANGLGRTTLAFLIADVLASSAGMTTLAIALSCDHQRMSLPAAGDGNTSLDLGDLLGDLPGFDETAHISPYVSVARSGAHVLSGPSELDDLAALEPAQLEALLDFAGRFYPLVVLDVGELSEPALRAVVRRADRVLLLGTPGAVEDLDEHSAVLAAIESERDDRATLVFNRVDEQRLQAFERDGGPSSHVLVPKDRDLIRALDAGDFELAGVRPIARTSLKRLALAAIEGLR